jgi:alpha-ketoglutaric semialdehyde dehydrogenase
LEGQLTATIHGTEDDLQKTEKLIRILERKVGRLIFNGFPTGIEVCPSMHHGGPYPATTHSFFTSIGTASILRFVRPLCYQNFPDAGLPAELRNKNERGILRLVDNAWTRDDI